MRVADNLARIREQIGTRRIKLIAVTKSASERQIEEAYQCGITEFGENRIKDAIRRRENLPPLVATQSNWHFIGHLQTNKVKQVVSSFGLIHSVDSLHLAQEISKEAIKRNTTQPVLLQVKIMEDPSKGGFSAEQLESQFHVLLQLPGIEIKGLMTMTPLTEDRQVCQRCFVGLRQLRDKLTSEHGVELNELSMGMSSDWQIAIECGATMIRLGRAIFNA